MYLCIFNRQTECLKYNVYKNVDKLIVPYKALEKSILECNSVSVKDKSVDTLKYNLCARIEVWMQFTCLFREVFTL